jgi:hypothetical protein
MPRRLVGVGSDAGTGRIAGVVDGIAKEIAGRGRSGRAKYEKRFVAVGFARVRRTKMSIAHYEPKWKRWLQIYSLCCYWTEPFQWLTVEPRYCFRVKQCYSF